MTDKNLNSLLEMEEFEINEAENTKVIVELLIGELKKVYKNGQTLRQFHAKMHGYVDAEFIVDSNLPKHLKVGLFKQPKTYKCKIRFSNGSPKLHSSDSEKGVMGLAMQLKDENNVVIQDFVLTTAPILSPGKVKAYKTATIALMGNILLKALYAINPLNWKDLYYLLKTFKHCPNLLEVDYYSATPYLFNNSNAVKYNVHPTSLKRSPMPKTERKDFLREFLVRDLASSEVSLDFRVQFREDPILQPIEDPRVEWTTPFQKVATIRINAQIFDTPTIRDKGEKMKFSPWTCLSEHRPLGGINRARKEVYNELAKFREDQNIRNKVNI